MAVDVIPYPTGFSKKRPFYIMYGYVQAVADRLGYRIIWGGNFDQDNDFYNDPWLDLAHFALI